MSYLTECLIIIYYFFFFFFNDTATTEIYTLSLHDALPILRGRRIDPQPIGASTKLVDLVDNTFVAYNAARLREACQLFRSEEHTSELQSRRDLVCRLLLEKKKKKKSTKYKRK